MIKVNLATIYFVLVCLLAVATGEEAEVKQVASDGVRLPWHTTDLYWEGASSVPDVKTIGVTFTVDRDVPDSVNLYIAPMGGQYLNKIMFYGGIQSNVNGWPSPPELRRGASRSRGNFFAMGRRTCQYRCRKTGCRWSVRKCRL